MACLSREEIGELCRSLRSLRDILLKLDEKPCQP